MRGRRDNEDGAALLTVLLLVAVMSVAALTATQLVGSSIQRSRVAQAASAASWQVAGAEEFGRVAIEELRQATEGELNDTLAGLLAPFEFPIENGVLLGQITEASNCLNLNALADAEDEAGGVRVDQRSRVMQLIQTLGFDETESEALGDALADWIDGDFVPRLRGAEDGYYATRKPPYRAANQPLAELSELRAILGYSTEVVATLRPFVCAYPDAAEVALNINTLRVDQAPLLVVALSGQITLETAIALIELRPLGGWGEVAEFLQLEDVREVSAELIATDMLSTRSSYLELVGVVELPNSTTPFRVLYSLPETQPVRIERRQYGER